jgi:hypothetical protein
LLLFIGPKKHLEGEWSQTQWSPLLDTVNLAIPKWFEKKWRHQPSLHFFLLASVGIWFCLYVNKEISGTNKVDVKLINFNG